MLEFLFHLSILIFANFPLLSHNAIDSSPYLASYLYLFEVFLQLTRTSTCLISADSPLLSHHLSLIFFSLCVMNLSIRKQICPFQLYQRLKLCIFTAKSSAFLQCSSKFRLHLYNKVLIIF